MLCWYDVAGRLTAPPLADQLDLSSARQYLLFNKQKIKVNLKKKESLGVFIRGGQEYGLGIYVTKIIPNSPSHNAGIQPGDQILKVNGRSFLGITHNQAVHVLRDGRTFHLLIDRVGKIPAMVQTQTEEESKSADEDDKDAQNRKSAREDSAEASTRRHWLMMNSVAQAVLTDQEYTEVMSVLTQYCSRTISIAPLTDELYPILRTKLKKTLFGYLRNVIEPTDVDSYDALLLKKELEELQLQEQRKALPETTIYGWNEKTTHGGPENRVSHQLPDKLQTDGEKFMTEEEIDTASVQSSENSVMENPKRITEARSPCSMYSTLSSDGMLLPVRRAVSSEHIHGRNEYPKNYGSLSRPELCTCRKEPLAPAASKTSAKPVLPICGSITNRAVYFNQPEPQRKTVRQLKRRSAGIHQRQGNDDSGYSTILSSAYSSDRGYQSEDELTLMQPRRYPDTDKLSHFGSKFEFNFSLSAWENRSLSSDALHGGLSGETVVYNNFTCDHLWAKSRKVWIPKIQPHLGLRIAGGAQTRQRLPVIVKIEPYGCASESGGLRVGSVVLGVDGQSLVGLEHEEVVWKIARAFRNRANRLLTLNVVNDLS